jgi:hypothetical protein
MYISNNSNILYDHVNNKHFVECCKLLLRETKKMIMQENVTNKQLVIVMIAVCITVHPRCVNT